MKWLTIGLTLALLGTPHTATASQVSKTATVQTVVTNQIPQFFKQTVPQTLLTRDSAKRILHMKKMRELNKTLAYLKTRVGKNWYVFSGISPIYGWDCSGLTLWTYKQLGISIKHSATVQKNLGHKTRHPHAGDIVAFGYKGWSGAFHVGIYLAKDRMIHAGGKSGDKTAIVSISKWGKENGNVVITYTHIIP